MQMIRPMHVEDSETVAFLSKQLGYSISLSETIKQIGFVLASPENCAFVATYDYMVIGWIHAFIALRIESKPFIEIGGLVVEESYRGKGVGRALVNHVLEWSLQKNIQTLRVRSNIIRTEAHQFYGMLGFKETKEQKVFELEILPQYKRDHC